MSLHHHSGIRVAHLERAGAFYTDALRARWLLPPVEMSGRAAAELMDGPLGTRVRLAMLGFGEGALELFEFVGPDVPEWATKSPSRLPHFGVQVDDVAAALERVEALGGRRLVRTIQRFGAASMIYVADPDDNVVELLDVPASGVVEQMLRVFLDGVV